MEILLLINNTKALQKLNARVLYLAQRKIAGDHQQPGADFADLFRVINEEQNLHRDQAAQLHIFYFILFIYLYSKTIYSWIL
jgi:hypothetical protein